MKQRKKLILSSALLLLLVLLTIGVTYALFTFSKGGTVENTLETGTVTLTYTEGKTGITLNEAYPMSDEQGKVLIGENNVFDFTVQANLSKSMSINYEVTAVKIPITDVTSLEDNEVKLYLERAIDPEVDYTEVLAPSNFVPSTKQSSLGSPVGSMILDSGIFTNQGTTIHNYRLRMWIASDTVIPSGESRKYGVRINVYATQTGVKMDDSCFTFDEATGTITEYSNKCSKDVIIPSQINGVDVVAIQKWAFEHKGLTSIVIPDTITTIGDGAFYDNKLTHIVLPSNLTIIGTHLVKDNQLQEITIPNGVTTIGKQSFSGNQLRSLIIPESVKFIGTEAFANNLLTSIHIPNTITSLNQAAFNNNLLSDEEAFIYQRNSDGSIDYTTLISYGGATRELIVIPENVITINSYAFYKIPFKEVLIPSGVETINNCVFCQDEALQKVINQTGKSFDWNNIILGKKTDIAFETGVVSYNDRNIIITDIENENISKVYQYNQEIGNDSFCVTGEEDTCQIIHKKPDTYPSGTIIKYKVNDNLEKYFHVVSDNEDTLTLQQRENTVYSKEWYIDSNDNTKGPTTILSALESATSNWTNVLDQTYTLGSTVFKDNAYTGCSYDASTNQFTCDTNTYTLSERIAKARMISVQEVHSLGCLGYEGDTGPTLRSCPVWVYNYLHGSKSYGGTVNQTGGDYGNNAAYWTMNTNSSSETASWYIHYFGLLAFGDTTKTYVGGRAVILIQK